MWIINSIFGVIVDLALFPFREMSPMIGLTCFSLAAGVGMLYVFKWTSDQKGLEDVKRKIHAGIFEIRLFSDDIRAIFTAQRDIFRYNFVYLRLALAPLLPCRGSADCLRELRFRAHPLPRRRERT